jgi:hypothetical protein
LGGYGGFGGGGGGGGADPGPVGQFGGGLGGFGGGNGGGWATGGGSGGGGGGGLGGAIFSNQGSITLINDTFTGNTAAGGRGGWAGSGGNSHPGASGQGLGGAVFVRNGALNAVFDTFSRNAAAQGGTDVYVLADNFIGGYNMHPGTGEATAVLIDDVLGQSRSPVSDFVAASNFTASPPVLAGSSHDFVSNNPAVGGLPASAVLNAASADPRLGHLAAHGGPTPTLAPLSGSPVRATGVTAYYPGTKKVIAVDQRGVARNPMTPDLGACEFAVL